VTIAAWLLVIAIVASVVVFLVVRPVIRSRRQVRDAQAVGGVT
jgi:flagellar biosynthesis/type III secretory pathway M-ring protein FliF/YscJ